MPFSPTLILIMLYKSNYGILMYVLYYIGRSMVICSPEATGNTPPVQIRSKEPSDDDNQVTTVATADTQPVPVQDTQVQQDLMELERNLLHEDSMDKIHFDSDVSITTAERLLITGSPDTHTQII